MSFPNGNHKLSNQQIFNVAPWTELGLCFPKPLRSGGMPKNFGQIQGSYTSKLSENVGWRHWLSDECQQRLWHSFSCHNCHFTHRNWQFEIPCRYHHQIYWAPYYWPRYPLHHNSTHGTSDIAGTHLAATNATATNTGILCLTATPSPDSHQFSGVTYSYCTIQYDPFSYSTANHNAICICAPIKSWQWQYDVI